MLAQTLIFLVITLGDLFALALLLRFMLQILRAPARNTFSQFVAALTDFVVRPARRVIPGFGGLDLATLLLAWLTQIAKFWIVSQLNGYALGAAAGIALAALAAIQSVRMATYVVMVAVVVQAVLSWVNPYNPHTPLLASVTRPFLRPFQKLVPMIANIDVSPLCVLIVCQLLLTVPLMWLEALVRRML